MTIHRLTHIGFMTDDIEGAAVHWARTFGLERRGEPRPAPWFVPEEGVMSTSLLVTGGGIEPLQAIAQDTPYRRARDAGRGIYHFGLRVSDMDDVARRLWEQELWINLRPGGAVVKFRRGWIDPESACGAHIELIDQDELGTTIEPLTPHPGVFAKFRSVGHIVSDMTQGVRLYRDAFGFTPESEGPTRCPEEGMIFLRFHVGDGPTLEVAQVVNSASFIGSLYDRYGEGLSYLVMEVTDLDEVVNVLSKRDVWIQVRKRGDVLPRRAWVHPRSTCGVPLLLVPSS